MKLLLLKSLEKNTSVTIPGFGAIMKLGSSYMYNEFLKFDDGKLAATVAEAKNCDSAQAKDDIDKWCAEIINTLNSGNSYTLEYIGILTKENGKTVLLKIETPEDAKKEESVQPQKPESSIIAEPEIVAEQPKASPSENLSMNLAAKMAIASIDSFSDKNALIAFTRGENRKTVIESLNKQLSILNGTKPTEKMSSENVATVTIEETEALILESLEKETQELENLLALTENLPDNDTKKSAAATPVSKESVTESKSPAAVEVPKEIIAEKEVKEAPVESKTAKATENPKAIPSPNQDDAALQVIADGVLKLEKEQKKRKKRRIILFTGLFLIVAGGGILGYLKQDYLLSLIGMESETVAKVKTEKPLPKITSEPSEIVLETLEETEQPKEIIEPEIIIEKTVEPEVKNPTVEKTAPIVKEPVVKQVTTQNTTTKSGKYEVVAGSFSVEDNANNLVTKLKENGFSTATTGSKSSALIKVIVGTYETKEAAENTVNDLKAKGLKGFVQKK